MLDGKDGKGRVQNFAEDMVLEGTDIVQDDVVWALVHDDLDQNEKT